MGEERKLQQNYQKKLKQKNETNKKIKGKIVAVELIKLFKKSIKLN